MLDVDEILVPIDFSETSSYALEHAIGLARKLGAKIHLVHSYPIDGGAVAPYGVPFPSTLVGDWRDAAQDQLDEWAGRVKDAGVEVRGTLSPLPAWEAATSLAADTHADLIVMGTRGLSGVKHVLLGSVTERTLRNAPCPVLVVRQPPEE